ncbi:MAG: hypothetical protein ACE363_08805 [Alphaproteobacteria bacterium]
MEGALVRQLLDNNIAAIRVPHFLSSTACEESREVLSKLPDWSFYEGGTPPLGRLGITQYEHFGAKQEYLSKAASEMVARDRNLQNLQDPLEKLLSSLNQVWPNGATIASEAGQTYFAGVFRRGTTGTIHADWAPRDAAGWSIADIRAQLGWNVYYELPQKGGNLVVYNRLWTPDVEIHARQRFNDYDPKVFDDLQCVEIELRVGDLVLFNARNAHMVTNSPNGDQRLSVGSFVGEMPDQQLVFWS